MLSLWVGLLVVAVTSLPRIIGLIGSLLLRITIWLSSNYLVKKLNHRNNDVVNDGNSNGWRWERIRNDSGWKQYDVISFFCFIFLGNNNRDVLTFGYEEKNYDDNKLNNENNKNRIRIKKKLEVSLEQVQFHSCRWNLIPHQKDMGGNVQTNLTSISCNGWDIRFRIRLFTMNNDTEINKSTSNDDKKTIDDILLFENQISLHIDAVQLLCILSSSSKHQQTTIDNHQQSHKQYEKIQCNHRKKWIARLLNKIHPGFQIQGFRLEVHSQFENSNNNHNQHLQHAKNHSIQASIICSSIFLSLESTDHPSFFSYDDNKNGNGDESIFSSFLLQMALTNGIQLQIGSTASSTNSPIITAKDRKSSDTRIILLPTIFSITYHPPTCSAHVAISNPQKTNSSFNPQNNERSMSIQCHANIQHLSKINQILIPMNKAIISILSQPSSKATTTNLSAESKSLLPHAKKKPYKTKPLIPIHHVTVDTSISVILTVFEDDLFSLEKFTENNIHIKEEEIYQKNMISLEIGTELLIQHHRWLDIVKYYDNPRHMSIENRFNDAICIYKCYPLWKDTKDITILSNNDETENGTIHPTVVDDTKINVSNFFIQQNDYVNNKKAANNNSFQDHDDSNDNKNKLFWMDNLNLVLQKSQKCSNTARMVIDSGTEAKKISNILNSTMAEDLIILTTEISIGSVHSFVDSQTTDMILSSSAEIQKKLTVPILPKSNHQNEKDNRRRKEQKVQSKKKAGCIHIYIKSLKFEVGLLPFGEDKLWTQETPPNAEFTKIEPVDKINSDASVFKMKTNNIDFIFCLPKPQLDTMSLQYIKNEKNIENFSMVTMNGGEAKVVMKRIDCSASFTPSILLPQMTNSNGFSEDNSSSFGTKATTFDSDKKRLTKRVCFSISCAAGADATITLTEPSPPTPQKYDDTTTCTPSGPKISLCFHSLLVEDNISVDEMNIEDFTSSNSKRKENNILLDCSGGFSLRLRGDKYENSSLTTEEKEGIFGTTMVNQIEISSHSPAMYITWSPVFMWFLESLLHRINSSNKYYQGLFCIRKKKKTKRTLTNVKIATNSTTICARAILTKGSIINLVTKELTFNIHNLHTLFWKKPNLNLKAGQTHVSFGESTFKVLEMTSIEFNDTFCLASDFAIQQYLMKKEGSQIVELMTDGLGRPILETFQILLGESVVLRLPHDLHLGEIIDDASKTAKMMFDGMIIGKLKIRKTSPRKYQLMDIKLKLPFIDATFLEEVQKPFNIPLSHRCKYPGYKTSSALLDLNESNLATYESDESIMLDRWRLSIMGADIFIKRDTPPLATQITLNELDEDKSRLHEYGPMVQGGQFLIRMKRILCVIHPLTLSNPLAVVRDAKVSGILYITALSENTPGAKEGQLAQVPVTSHHSKCVSPSFFNDDIVSRKIKINGGKSSLKNHNCPCNYAVQYISGMIPPKIYFDMNIRFEDVDVTYGMVLATAMPKLQEIIRRLIPPPRESDNSAVNKPPPLTWWDNLRYQFHGELSLYFLSFSFRWLLDVPAQYDWSILLTGKKTSIKHSVGTFRFSIEDMIISVPGSSYHMLRFDNTLDESKTKHFASTYIDNTSKERHSLMLVPFLELSLDFRWDLLHSNNIETFSHHLPYLVPQREVKNETIQTQSFIVDGFKEFRSNGVKLSINLSCSPNSTFAVWLALRIDVLPWLTHKNPSIVAPTRDPEQNNEALPQILALKFNASLSNLQVGAWLFDDDDVSLLDSLSMSRETISDGICLIIPKALVKISNEGKKVELRGPIQAALLNIIDDPLVDDPAQKKKIGSYLTSFEHDTQNIISQQLYGSSDLHKLIWFHENPTNIFRNEFRENMYYQRHDEESYRSFECLQFWSTQIKDFDYLLVVDQIDIMDKSLDSIKMNVCHDLSSGKVIKNDSSYDSKLFESSNTDNPWTVLVLGLKLLWSVDIRDSVMSIVQDLLFTINFMKVNVRGTPQNMAQNTMKNMTTRDQEISTNLDTNQHLDTYFKDIDESCVETVAGGDNSDVTLIQTKKDEENASFQKKNQPISHLDYLLETTIDSDHDIKENTRVAASPDGHDLVMETAKLTKVRYFGDKRDNVKSNAGSAYSEGFQMSESSLSKTDRSEKTLDDMIPTLNIHLANPQIQLYSESTGGSVVLAIRGAYIEGRKFAKLFTHYSSSGNDKVSAESLLRRTDFEYKLEKMEIYSMRTDVDVTVGLQWLSLNQIKPVAKPLLVRAEQTLSKDNDAFASENFDSDGISSESRKKASKYFPANLKQYETRDFIVPNLFKKIMDPCTFTTRQEFFRPPIDLTKEELAEYLLKCPPLSFEGMYASPSDWAIDHVEILMDELSFFLDSYQFSTTIDLIRNVLLEPPKPPRHRHEEFNDIISDETKLNKQNIDEKPSESKTLDFENMIREWFRKTSKQYKGKKGKTHIKNAARDILSELEENQTESTGPSSRRIEYTLSKAKWKIKCPDFVDDVEINLTGFKGQHDFSADGSVTSQITLEDIRVSSQKPGPDAIGFFDPTAIVTTVVGVELSPCQRCGCHFDRSQNESNSCIFHSGEFLILPGENIPQWTCCQAMWKGAPGCTSRPHTGMERAIAMRLEALPRKVDGVTMYKHIEANIYPGVPHTLIIQVTKNLGKLFMTYFIGEGDDSANKSSKTIQLEDDNQSSMSSQSSLKTTTGLINKGNNSALNETSNKKIILFGKQHTESSSQNDAINVSVDEDNAKIAEVTKSACKDDEEIMLEILFLKRLRVGDINVNVSLAGFGSIVDTSNLSIAVASFNSAYMLGPGNYVGKKYITYAVRQLLKSLAGSGFEKFLDKIAGKSSGKKAYSGISPVDKNGENTDSNISERSANKSRSRLLLGLPDIQTNLQSPRIKKKSRFSKK